MRYRWYIVAVLLFMTLVYSTHLTRTIQYDEAFTYFNFIGSPFIALLNYALPNNHLLHSFFVWMSTSLMGDSLIALRFPAFAFGILSLALIFRVGSRVAGHPVGLMASVLLAVTYLFAEYVPNARGYTLSIALSLLFFEEIYFGTDHFRHNRRFLFLSTLLVLTLPTMILLIGALLIWRVYSSKRHLAVMTHYGVPAVFGSIIGLIFYIGGIMNSEALRESVFGYRSTISLIIDWMMLTFAGTTGFALTAGLFLSWKSSRRFKEVIAAILLTILIVSIVQQIITGHVFYPRNYVYAVPFVVLLAASGWAHLLRSLPYAAVIIALLISGSIYLSATLSAPTTVTALEAALKTHARPDDFILPGCCIDVAAQYIYRDTTLFEINENTARFVIIPTPDHSLSQLAGFLSITDTATCTPEMWDSFEVYICPAPDYRNLDQ